MINRYMSFSALYLASATVVAAPMVTGNTISWPDDGWYQVQRSSDYTTLCNGGSSCVVPAGNYKVINHTTGEKFRDIVVSGSEPDSSPISFVGNVISWPDDGWYQVQRSSDYTTICNGGSSCVVEAGMYKVINHTTGEIFRGIAVQDDNINGDDDGDLINNDLDNCPLIYNPDQAATIGNRTDLGDVCDDEDADNIVDAGDNCPLVGNPDQSDTDGNGVGDVCQSCGLARMIGDITIDGEGSFVMPRAGLDGVVYFSNYERGIGGLKWAYDPRRGDARVYPLGHEMLQQAGGLTALEGKLYFSGYDSLHGVELWVYDPSQLAEPTLVADIFPGSEGSYPGSLTVLGNKLYFSASDSVHGSELWVYDPASPQSGAILVADINPTRGSSPRDFTVYDDKLYFFAIGVSGSELWVYELALGASYVAHVLPDDGPPSGQAVALDGKLYFRRWRGDDGGLLWAYDLLDPSVGVTVQAQIPELFTDDDNDDLVAYNGKLFFSYRGELWQFDPANAAAGITLTANVRIYNYPENFQVQMVELGGKLYMNADNGVAGFELMVLDDDNPTTPVTLVADINPGPEESFPVNMSTFDGKLYFSADDGVHGHELWEYDPACR